MQRGDIQKEIVAGALYSVCVFFICSHQFLALDEGAQVCFFLFPVEEGKAEQRRKERDRKVEEGVATGAQGMKTGVSGVTMRLSSAYSFRWTLDRVVMLTWVSPS